MSAGVAMSLAVLVLLSGLIGALTLHSFSGHMAAHVAVVAVAAPLLALSLHRRPTWLGRPMTALAACGFEFVVVWGWHVPVLHAAARSHLPAFAVEQLSFLLAGLLVWMSAIPERPSSGASPRPALAGIGALLMTSMHMTLLGGLLAVSSRSWYHEATAQALWDQQLGGVIMLAVGGVAYLTGALTLLARSLRNDSGWTGA